MPESRFKWGMVERIGVVLLCAVLLEFLGNVALHRWQDRELVSAAQTQRIADQLVDAVSVASAAPREDRARLVQRLDIENLALNWVPRTVITDSRGSQSSLADLHTRLVTLAPELARLTMRLNLLPSPDGQGRDLVGTVALPDSSWVSFRVTGFLDAAPDFKILILLHMLLIAGVIGVTLMMVQALVRPLRDLAQAADETGRNHVAQFIPAGPHEVRRVATAFSAMQERLVRILEENTQTLINVSHDLRTPIQRLRLRAGLLQEGSSRDAIEQDLLEMERFIDSALAYIRSGEDETPRLIDISALLNTVVDDARDLGANAVFDGPDSLLLTTRPTALKRMVGNLIDNAAAHGDEIRVVLSGVDGIRAEISVEDDGPGIPQELRADALRPFHRLDRADDSEEAKGAGLGLAFVQRTVEAHGGTISLETSAALGGLSARIVLPARIVDG